MLAVDTLLVACNPPSGGATTEVTAVLPAAKDREPTAVEADPTKDYRDDLVIVTPAAGEWATIPPGEGMYSGMSAAEVAEAVRLRYERLSPVPVSVVRFADVDVTHAQQLGLSPGQTAYGEAPDVAVVLDGQFRVLEGGLSTSMPGTARYMLLVIDRSWGEYSTATSDDLESLLSLMP